MNATLKTIVVLFIVGIYVFCPTAYAIDEYVSASESISEFVKSISLTKKALVVDPNKKKEFDFLLNVNVTDENKDAIRRIQVRFPNGERIFIRREVQKLPGREHAAEFIEGVSKGLHSWSYRNIGIPNLDEYGDGTYEIYVTHAFGTENLKIKFLNPDTGKELPVPEFGKLLAPEENSEVTSPVTIKVGDHKKPVGLYFKMRNPKDGELVEKEFTIPIGTNESMPIELVPGRWGAELICSENVSGKINGITWQLDLSTAYEYKFKVKESGK